MKTVYYNAKAVLRDRTEDLCVIVENGKILGLSARADMPDAERFDCGGLYLGPGFADIHVHGGGGYSAMSDSPEEIVKMAEAHLRHGVTGIVPTTLAAPIIRLQRAIDTVEQAMSLPGGAGILGVHLEGPFLSPKKAGAQAPGNLLEPTEENVLSLLDRSPIVRMIGAAPELPGGMRVGELAAERGVVASVAHSDADFETAEKALAHGYSDVTHIFSACSAMHKEGIFRRVGVAEAGLALDGYTAQFIGDLRHLPAGAVRLILKAKGPSKAYLISDGLEYTGSDLPEGTEVAQENGQKAVIEDGVMKLADRSCLAGSVTPLDRMVRNLIRECGVSLPDAVAAASSTPLSVIGFGGRKGRIAPGYDADLILFDENIGIKCVITDGIRREI